MMQWLDMLHWQLGHRFLHFIYSASSLACDTCLAEEDDWNGVILECSSLAAKWDQLSGYLGLSMGTIETIIKSHPYDTSGCWNEALKLWIKQNYNTEKYGVPSWRTLLKAIAMVDKLLFKKLADNHQLEGTSPHILTHRYFTYSFIKRVSELLVS